MKDSNIKEDMNKNGYVILKNILSQDMVKSYHKLIGDYFGINGSGGGKSMWKPDSFNDPGLFDLHKLFSVDNFINPLQELTDNKLIKKPDAPNKIANKGTVTKKVIKTEITLIVSLW